MDEDRQLRLHEEILLLVLRDEEGTVASGPVYEYAMAGGILAELLLGERLSVETSGKKDKPAIRMKSSTSMSDEVIDECLAKVRASEKQKSPRHWISKFAQTKKLKHRVASRLCDLGILRSDRQKVLWLFSHEVFPELDHETEAEIIARPEHAIFSDTPDVGVRTLLLASLADSADLLGLVFDKQRLKARKGRIKKMIEGEMVGRATAEVIQAVQAALLVSSIATATSVTTAR
jgi:hypothetical protein